MQHLAQHSCNADSGVIDHGIRGQHEFDWQSAQVAIVHTCKMSIKCKDNPADNLQGLQPPLMFEAPSQIQLDKKRVAVPGCSTCLMTLP